MTDDKITESVKLQTFTCLPYVRVMKYVSEYQTHLQDLNTGLVIHWLEKVFFNKNQLIAILYEQYLMI